jgi:PTS system galactosamine-specific IIB component
MNSLAEPNIVMTRVDNRLIHGQVGSAWAGSVRANLILVADDDTAANELQKQLMKMAADSVGIQSRFFTLDKTIEVIHKASSKQAIFLVCATPGSVLKLMKGGVPIKTVNIGNMMVRPGTRVFHEPHVYVDDQDIKDIEEIKSLGAEVFIQIGTTDKKYKL